MILVTGAGGFIGNQVCQLLSVHNQDVLGVDRGFQDSLNFRGIQTVQGDLRDRDFLSSVFQNYSLDAIIHLAGLLNSASRQRPEEAMHINIGCSLHLLQLAVQFHVDKFIFGSSISVYGPKRYSQHGVIFEAEPASPNNIYGVSKRYVEIVGEQYRQADQLQFIALRISMVVGAGVMHTASRWRSEIFEALQTRSPTRIQLPYTADEFLPLIHVADLAEIIKRLVNARQTSHTTYNTPSENWQCSDLAEYLRSLNPNIELVFSPPNIRGDPEAINGNRFIEEFGYRSIPFRERLRRSIELQEN